MVGVDTLTSSNWKKPKPFQNELQSGMYGFLEVPQVETGKLGGAALRLIPP